MGQQGAQISKGARPNKMVAFTKIPPWERGGRNQSKVEIKSPGKMDQTAEEKKVRDRIRKKVNEVSSVSQSLLSPVQDHINFTLQKAYFKCAYECFDRTRTHSEISRCAENCSVPITKAQNQFDNEMSVFQERLNRSLLVCQDKFETANLQKTRNEAVIGLETCVNQTVDDAVKTLPNLVTRMKKSLSIID